MNNAQEAAGPGVSTESSAAADVGGRTYERYNDIPLSTVVEKFHSLLSEMQEYPHIFRMLTKMSFEQFNKLVQLVSPKLPPAYREGQIIMPNSMRILIAIRHLSGGREYHAMAFEYHISFSTCATIINEVCQALIDTLSRGMFERQPSPVQFKQTAAMFAKKLDLPHCLGAVDTKHIKFHALRESGKNRICINVVGVCDPDNCFTMAEVTCVDDPNDGQAFKRSILGQGLAKGTLQLPQPEALPKSQTVCPYFFVAVESFPLEQNLMIPHSRHQAKGPDALDKRVFNYRIGRALRTAENGFGVMATNLAIMDSEVELSPERAVLYVKACICLHNFLMRSRAIGVKFRPRAYYGDVYGPKDQLIHPGQWRQREMFTTTHVKSRRNAPEAYRKVRDCLSKYLSTEGSLGYQEDLANQPPKKKQKKLHRFGNIMDCRLPDDFVF